ncbi:MAG: hypothetical protein HKL79_02340 [Thermoplasmata archaeon]|nr:hypothetical protein [Thermoplasmata archaeon]
MGWVNSTDLNVTDEGVGGSNLVLSLAYDGDAGTIYAGLENESQNYFMGNIIGLNASTGGHTSSTPVGDFPYAIVWSAQTHEILSANVYDSNVSIVNDMTNRLVQTLPVGLGPDALAYDSLTGSVYAANYWSNNLSVLIPPPSYAVSFTETGMPPSAGGGVAFNGGSTTPFGADGTLTFDGLTNNTYHYTIRPATGYYELVSSNPGSPITVSGSNVTVSVVFEAIYTVTFTDIGMPPSAGGGVAFNGSAFTPFARGVDGLGVVTFSNLTNGSYRYEIEAGPGYQLVGYFGVGYTQRPSSTVNGSVTVGGIDAGVNAQFEAIYSVAVDVSGIPNGTLWTVEITSTSSRAPTPENWTANSTRPTALFQLPNGTYSYVIMASGYPATTGTFSVNGQAQPVPVTVSSSSSWPAWWVYALIGVVITGIVVGVVIGLMRHRRPPATAASSPPPMSRS